MKFHQYLPTERLSAYINYYVVTEAVEEREYKVFPSSNMVIGFQYKGKLSTIQNNLENPLATAGITGIVDRYKMFKNAPHTGTVLVYFTEIGFTYFSSNPAHELFNLSVSLEDVFEKNQVNEVEEKLAEADSDQQRVKMVEQFLLSQLKSIQTDHLIVEAVKRIYKSKGSIRIKNLTESLNISQSPFEKRFRKIVGTSPKKFATIVRFNTVLANLNEAKSLTDICYEHHFFDQAHFIKDFKQFTGETPDNFKRLT